MADNFANIEPSTTNDTAESTGSNGFSKSKARKLRKKRVMQRMKSAEGANSNNGNGSIEKENNQPVAADGDKKKKKKPRKKKSKHDDATSEDVPRESCEPAIEVSNVDVSGGRSKESPIVMVRVEQNTREENQFEVEHDVPGQRATGAEEVVTPENNSQSYPKEEPTDPIVARREESPIMMEQVEKKVGDENQVEQEFDAPVQTTFLAEEGVTTENSVELHLKGEQTTPIIETTTPALVEPKRSDAPITAPEPKPAVVNKPELKNVYHDDNDADDQKGREKCECSGCIIS